MRTKEPKNNTDYGMVSRLSIQRDFRDASFRRRNQIQQPDTEPKQGNNIKRVLSISDKSNYAKYKRFFVGKLVRILRPAPSGGYYVEFVRDNDRVFLNANAEWHDKREYLLDGAKFD